DLSPTVRLLILSDTPGNNDVPEPATGLLLGAALPALLGIRRQFSKGYLFR
ncbi:MAG: PEP-CTERM sorting domain-containing protein, partial [Bacillati bacterium ANGP1]